MTELYRTGIAYKTMNTARSALSSLGIILDGFVLGQHPLIKKFLLGVFKKRPPKVRYSDIWDASKVLSYLKTLPSVEKLSLKLLTYKLAMLIALTQASRCQSLQLLSLKDIKKGPDYYVLQYSDSLKQSRPGISVPNVVLRQYTPDRRLCVVNTLTEYIKRTENLRGDNTSLFISYLKPFGSVTTSTISRWLRNVMFLSGIDITKFKTHSIRSASTSKAKLMNIPMCEILKVAGWTNEHTFAQYYNKTVTLNSTTYADAILSGN